MTNDFRAEQNDDGVWEVRDRAGVWYADHPTKREAQRDARRRNEQ